MITVDFGGETFTIPYADLLPPLTGEQRAALQQDIKQRGVVVPIIVDDDNRVIDGQHRLTIAAELGLGIIPIERRSGLTADQARELCHDLNVHRRQLSAEERQEAAQRLREQGKSLRQISETLGVSHETVRTDLRSGVKNLTPDSTPTGPGVPSGTPGPAPSIIPDLVLPPGMPAPEPEPEPRITGRDGKQYPASQPQAKRQPDSTRQEARQQAIAEATELHEVIMTADAAINNGRVAKSHLLGEFGGDVRALVLYIGREDEICAAFEQYSYRDDIPYDINRVRRLLANIARRLSVIEGGKQPTSMGGD